MAFTFNESGRFTECPFVVRNEFLNSFVGQFVAKIKTRPRSIEIQFFIFNWCLGSA